VVELAPTAFGPVSVRAESHVASGHVTATVQLPTRNAPRRILLRARVPEGWRVTSVRLGSEALRVDDRGTVHLTGEMARSSSASRSRGISNVQGPFAPR
jgi:hypothetical protein